MPSNVGMSRARQTQLFGDRAHALIARPKRDSPDKLHRGEQVSVNEADATSEQRASIDEGDDFFVVRNRRLRQIRQIAQNPAAPAQIPEREFSPQERMPQDHPISEHSHEKGVALAKIIDPDGGVDEDQPGADRRRGIGFRSGSLPPRRASRLALSRSISAFKASRTRLAFSVKPVNAWALATSSSSSARVVRIVIFPFEACFYHRIVPIFNAAGAPCRPAQPPSRCDRRPLKRPSPPPPQSRATIARSRASSSAPPARVKAAPRLASCQSSRLARRRSPRA
jgi:hypothetical protein